MRRLTLASKLLATNGPAEPRGGQRPGGLRGALRALGLRNGALLLCGGLVAGVAVWSLQSGTLARQADATLDRLTRASAEAGLAVQDVYVNGRVLTDAADLRAALGVKRGTPILSVAPASTRARIQSLPWIAEAAVERDLPETIRISLRERRPLALWQYRGRVRVIDRQGETVAGAAPGRFKDLPLVVGDGAPAHTRDILNVLRAEPVLAKRVQAAVRVSDRRWNVRLGNGVDVKLPDDDPRSAWAKLARLEKRQGILQRDIEAVDLRLPDQLLVRLAPGAAPYAAALGAGEAT